MIDRAGSTAIKVACVCAAAALGFILFESTARALETTASLWALHHLGAHAAFGIAPTTVLIVPRHHAAFDVLITPSCSSLASLLAFGCLAPLTPWRPPTRRVLSFGMAAVVIAIGNVLRIAASIAVGLIAGRASLVLFHDWVGSMFTFVYTLGGFILMLTLLLPRSAGPHVAARSAPVVLRAA